jgi:hypothetical protein
VTALRWDFSRRLIQSLTICWRCLAGLNIEFEAQTDRLSIEFKVLRDSQTLKVIMWGLDAGHQVIWEMPLNDVPSEAPVAYERFVRAAEEKDEVGFARRHKCFLLRQWERFVEMFSKLSSLGSKCSLPILPFCGDPSPIASGQLEDDMI